MTPYGSEAGPGHRHIVHDIKVIAPITPNGAYPSRNPAAAHEVPVALPPGPGLDSGRPLHRLAEVRRQEGLKLRTIARRLGIPVAKVLEQERPATDLRLSDLYRWQDALGVPVSELLEESGYGLSRQTKLRATLVRIIKTVRSIQESARQRSIRRMGQTLAEELIEIMPELEGIVAWPKDGQKRGAGEPGQAYVRGIGFDVFYDRK